jgi:hypothetical protein
MLRPITYCLVVPVFFVLLGLERPACASVGPGVLKVVPSLVVGNFGRWDDDDDCDDDCNCDGDDDCDGGVCYVVPQSDTEDGDTPAEPPAPAKIPASIRIANPAEHGVTWKFLIDGQVETLPAGYAMELSETCVLEFDRGGSAGTARFPLTDGTYTFTPTGDGHWKLDQSPYETEELTPEDQRMFQEMFGDAGLTPEEMKVLEQDWRSSTSAERKAAYESFMERLKTTSRS